MSEVTKRAELEAPVTFRVPLQSNILSNCPLYYRLLSLKSLDYTFGFTQANPAKMTNRNTTSKTAMDDHYEPGLYYLSLLLCSQMRAKKKLLA